MTKNLLTSRDMLKELGLRRDDKKWRGIRTVLVEQYGFNYIPGAGRVILRKNFEKFLTDKLDYQGE